MAESHFDHTDPPHPGALIPPKVEPSDEPDDAAEVEDELTPDEAIAAARLHRANRNRVSR